MYLINRLCLKRFILFVVLFSFIFVLPLAAQSEDWFYGKKIKSIKFSAVAFTATITCPGFGLSGLTFLSFM